LAKVILKTCRAHVWIIYFMADKHYKSRFCWYMIFCLCNLQGTHCLHHKWVTDLTFELWRDELPELWREQSLDWTWRKQNLELWTVFRTNVITCSSSDDVWIAVGTQIIHRKEEDWSRTKVLLDTIYKRIIIYETENMFLIRNVQKS